jgi:hypothetical protein
VWILAILLLIGIGAALKLAKPHHLSQGAASGSTETPLTPTPPAPHRSAQTETERRSRDRWPPLNAIERIAEISKTLLQMGIGITIVAVLAIHVIPIIWSGNFTIDQLDNDDFDPLRIVGIALVFSTAVELAKQENSLKDKRALILITRYMTMP